MKMEKKKELGAFRMVNCGDSGRVALPEAALCISSIWLLMNYILLYPVNLVKKKKSIKLKRSVSGHVINSSLKKDRLKIQTEDT